MPPQRSDHDITPAEERQILAARVRYEHTHPGKPYPMTVVERRYFEGRERAVRRALRAVEDQRTWDTGPTDLLGRPIGSGEDLDEAFRLATGHEPPLTTDEAFAEVVTIDEYEALLRRITPKEVAA